MRARTLSLVGSRHLVALGLALIGLTAMVAVLAVPGSPVSVSIAHGSGSGGCFSNAQPVCTFKNNDALADFGSVGSDGCTITEAFLEPFQSLARPGGTTSQAVFVAVNKFDKCQGVLLQSASNADSMTGTTDFTGTIQLDTKLSSAQVTGTAPMFDATSGALVFTATIDVAWQGFGSITRAVDSSHFHAPGLVVNSHFNGQSRAAEASGTFTDETGTNLATPPALNAELDNATSGTVQISKS